MNSRDLARGGLLAAAAVVLLLIGSLSPYLGAGCVVFAGVLTAVPLLRENRVRIALLLYLAAGVLSLLLVPRKGLAAAYIVFGGLYPLLKYLIECLRKPAFEWLLKLLDFNASLLVGVVLIRVGFLPDYSTSLERSLPVLIGMFLGANIAFVLYDIGLSRLISLLRHRLPPS